LNDDVNVFFNGNPILMEILNADVRDENTDYNDYQNNLINIFYKYTSKELQKIVKTIYNFKYTYYCLKFKKRFRDFLWQRLREPIAMKRYHPSELQKMLDVAAASELDENELFEQW
jgi:hypothetical protein